MALLVLEVAVLGVLGTLLLASRTLRRAERLERAAGQAEAVLDSLRRGAEPGSASRSLEDVSLTWSVDGDGRVELAVTDEAGGTLLSARTRVPPK